MGLVYKIDVPGFIRINPNAGGADASIPVKLWSSNDGINWVGPTEVTQGNLDPSHASYDASIGFSGQYGCIQRQGGTNIAAWYPTGSEALTTLTFPDTQGFECFEVGDVVQGVSPTTTVEPQLIKEAISADWDYASNVSKPSFTFNDFGTDDSDTGYGVIYKLNQKPASEVLWRFYSDSAPGGLDFDVYYSDNGVDWTKAHDKAQIPPLNTPGLPTPAALYYRLELFSGGGRDNSLGWFAYALSSEGLPYAEIVDKNSDANTITVDGGEWFDGTSDPGTDRSYIWSSLWTGFGSLLGSVPSERPKVAFNGDTTLSNEQRVEVTEVYGDDVVEFKFNCNGVYPFEVLIGRRVNGASPVFNGVEVTISDSLAVTDAEWVSLGNTMQGQNVFSVTSTKGFSTKNNTDIFGFKIAGNLLVDADGQTTLSKETAYDTKLTVDSDKDLADMTGAVFMSDGAGAPGPYTQTPYKLVTSDIESVNDTDPANITLTFPGDVSTNPDLQYFKAGDVVNQYVPGGGDIYMVTDAGVPFFDDPGFLTFNSTADDIFSDTENPGNSYIVRANSWLEVQFLGGVQVQNTLYIYVGDYNGFPYEVYINDEKIDGPEENGKWPNQEFAATSNAIPFSGILKKFKIVCDTGPVLRQFFVDQDVLANKITGTVAYQKLQEVKVISTGYPDSNTMVVDGGEWLGSDGSATDNAELGWNQDEVWSANTSGQYYGAQYTWTNVFNGVIGTTFSSGVYVKDGSTAQVDFNPPIACRKLELNSSKGVLTGDPLSGNIEVTVLTDGIQNTYTISPTVNTPSIVWMEQLMPAKTVITSIKLGKSLNVNPGWGSTITAIKVDDRLLVDSGIAGAPTPVVDTHVEYQTNGGEGTIIDINTDDNTLLVINSGDGDNRWIAENKADTDFYVAGPNYVDSPLLTTNVELQSSEFSTDPDGVDGLKEIIWNLNGVDQPGTTLNPYKPTGLSFNTEYTVKVKHVAQSIGESEWSTSTTFTTGASRSLKEYYVKQIRELEGGA